MQALIREFEKFDQALMFVREIVDEMPVYMGDRISYTIAPDQENVKVFVNRKENLCTSKESQ